MVARAAIRYLLREGLGPLCPPAVSPHLAVVVPGQREGDISGRSDKFAPDYAPVTFIFIEILHSNERPYFSYRTVRPRALDLSLSSPSFISSAGGRAIRLYVNTQIVDRSKMSIVPGNRK